MNKIEFSDINKFLTSLGLIFIGAAILLPWFINQNIGLIILEQDKIDKTTPTAKAIITKQQDYLLFISQHLNCIVATLIGLGILLLIIGIYRWKKRQYVIDEIQNEELKSKRLQNISKDEKKEIIENEIGPSVENKSTAVQKYIDIENLVYLKLAPYYKVNYETFQNIRIGRSTYDVILKSKYIEKREDLILEIKYFDKLASYNRLLESINRFLLSIDNYENTQKRKVTPIILLIFSALDSNQAEDQKTKLKTYLTEIRPDLRIKFFKESEIHSVETPQLLAGE
ncbi:MAG: hypothetical protein K8R85_07865 [Bacteroidetes bacterium]|nr:hypothetical protein [Bacteroidota bacterium]